MAVRLADEDGARAAQPPTGRLGRARRRCRPRRAVGGDHVGGAEPGPRRRTRADDDPRLGGRPLADGVRRAARARARRHRRRARACAVGPRARPARRGGAAGRGGRAARRERHVRLGTGRASPARELGLPGFSPGAVQRRARGRRPGAGATRPALRDLARPDCGHRCDRLRRRAAVVRPRRARSGPGFRGPGAIGVRNGGGCPACGRRQGCAGEPRRRGRRPASVAAAAHRRSGVRGARRGGQPVESPPARPRRAGHAMAGPALAGARVPRPAEERRGRAPGAGRARSSGHADGRAGGRARARCRDGGARPDGRRDRRHTAAGPRAAGDPAERPRVGRAARAPLCAGGPAARGRHLAQPAQRLQRPRRRRTAAARRLLGGDPRRAAIGAGHRRGRAPRRLHRPGWPGARSEERGRRWLGRRDRSRPAVPPARGADAAPAGPGPEPRGRAEGPARRRRRGDRPGSARGGAAAADAAEGPRC